MDEETKALVERLRSRAKWLEPELDALDENEVLAAVNRIEAQAAEIERLREAGTKLAGYAGHDAECEDVTGAYPGSCSCGYTHAWKAWHSLAGKAAQ